MEDAEAKPIDPPLPPAEVAPARPSTMARLEKGSYPTVPAPAGNARLVAAKIGDFEQTARKTAKPRGKSQLSPCNRHVALTRYLGMGPTRSQARLLVMLKEEFGEVKAPDVRTLSQWSSKHNWKAAVEEYEAQLADEVRKKLVKEDAKDVYDEITAFRKVLKGVIDNTQNILSGRHKRPDGTIGGPAIVGTAKELTQLLDTAVKVSTHLQLLEGNPTQRGEVRVNGRIARMSSELSPEQLEARYRRYVGAHKSKMIEG